MKNRLTLLAAVAGALLCCGCVNSTEVVLASSEYGLHVYERHGAAGPEALSIGVAGLKIVQSRDRSLVIVFRSGRRESLGIARADPPVNAISFFFEAPLEPVHQLPAALSADIRRGQQPDTTDGLRAAWALLATDHIPVRGESRNWRFIGWLRLTNQEWATLFDAVKEAKTMPSTSPARNGG